MLLIVAATLNANAKIAKVEYQNHIICPGDSIVFKNGAVVVKGDQEVWDTIPSLAPSKDSTIVKHKVMLYNLGTVVNSNYELEVGSSYLWEGQTIIRAGEYYSKVYKSKYCDCDSLVRHLTVTERKSSDKYYVIKDTTICEGASVMWHGQERTMQDVYRYEAPAAGTGKDTVYVLYLQVEKPFYRAMQLETSVFPFHFMDYDFAVPGTRDFEFKSAAGCDSIYHVSVVYKTIIDESYATFCQGGSYTWPQNGATYSYPGTYYDYLSTADGDRDSVTYILHLSMNSAAQTTYLHESICEGSYITIAGEKFSTQGTHQRKLQTVNGCDSLIVLSLQVLKADTVDTVAVIEAGKSLTWKGNTYSAEGEYYSAPYTNRFGCDSVVRLTLTTHAVDTICDTITSICPNTTYTWMGISASKAGTFSRLEKVNEGKDILYSLTIKNVLPMQVKDTAFVLCSNDNITFYGQTLSEDGLYVIQATCDTVYHVQVTKAQQSVREYRAVFDGGSYNWYFTTLDGVLRSKTNIKQAGVYDTLFTNVTTGCDDLYRLYLYRKVKKETEATICAGEKYHWDVTDLDYDATGNYEYKVRSVDNMRDSIDYTLKLTVNEPYTKRINKTICEGSFVSIGGQQFNTTGEHTVVLQTVDGCDSTIILNLLVVSQDITDTVAHIKEGTKFKWRGIDREIGGTYTDTVVNASGCNSITRLFLVTHRIDTIDTLITMCPGTSYTWNGITTNNGGTSGLKDTTRRYDEENFKLYRLIADKKQLVVLPKFFQICDENPVVFMDSVLDKAGTFDLQYSCDTIYRVTISKPAVAVKEFNAIFDGTTTYTWSFKHEGATKTYGIATAGTHIQKLTNKYGCEDTYILHLTVDSMTYHFRDSLTVCEGEDFEWQGYTNLSTQYVGQTHEYTMGYKTVVGKRDSVYHLKLTVLPKKYTNLGTVYFLSFPTTYLGQSILSPGSTIYTATLSGAAGCDSIVTFTAQRKVVEEKITEEICEGDTYQWLSHNITGGGTFNEIEKAVDGSDSVLHILELKSKPITRSQLIKTICEGGFYHFGGQNITKSGVYTDTIVNVNGCDSIVELRLNVQSPITTVLVRERMQGDTIHWGKRILTSPIVFDSIMTSRLGCDSIVRMVLNANHLDTVRMETTICNGDKYEWLGQNYYSAGEYKNIDTLDNKDVVISILTLHVEGLTKDTINKPYSICQGDSVMYLDSVYTKPGTYYYPYDCNTVHRVQVTITPTQTHITNATFDGKTPYIWKKEQNGTSADIIKTEAGTYDTLVAVPTSSCFDLYRLYLTVDTFSYHFHEKQSACEGEIVNWQGRTYSNLAVGTHEIYIEGKTTTGYDSIYHLTLTVYPKYNVVERVEVDTFPYDYRGIRFNNPGMQELHLTSVNGCDSTVRIYATQRALVEHEYATICKGDMHPWHGKNYSVGGDYMIRDLASSGDSINYILHLTVLAIPDTYVNATICRGDFYTFNGKNLNESGVYRENLKNNGCDSVVVLSLSVVDASQKVINLKVPADSAFVWHSYNIAANVEGTFQFDTLNIYGCDSSTVLNLTRYKEDTLIRTVTICPDSVYTWDGETRNATGTHTWVKLRPDGNSTRYILNLTVLQKIQKDLRYTLCVGEQVTIGDETFTKDTSFFYQQTCDTVYHVFINRLPAMVHNFEADFDGTEPYKWIVKDGNGIVIINESYSTAGTYSKIVQNSTTGCNDIYRLLLRKIAPDEQTYKFDEKLTVCEGEVFKWRGIDRVDWSRQNVGTTSHYYENYTTVYGKDSIYHLELTVRAIARTNERITFCDSIRWNNEWIRKDTTIVDTFKTVYGCDSISSTSLVKGSSIYRMEYDSIAPGEVLYWHGKTITKEGVYEDKQISDLGCDIVYNLDVHFKQELPSIKTRTERHTMCEGSDGYTWWKSKQKYYETGLYYDTVWTSTIPAEIDSIYILNLTVNPIIRVNETVSFPRSSFPIYYRGELFSGPAKKDIKYISSTGCDSIITVIVNYTHLTQNESATICAGEKYPWHDKYYDATGFYSYTIKDKDKFDSITYTLDLKVKETPVTYVDSTICRGNYILFGGEQLSENGTYRDTIDQGGCDSVVILTLHVVETQGTTEFRRRNPGDSPITWNGQHIDTTGVYYHHYEKNGCWLTDVLVMTVNKVDTIDSIATICPGEKLVWHGIEAEATGIYTKPEKQPNDDWNYYRLTLTVPQKVTLDTTLSICSGESVTFNGIKYTKAGVYEDPYNNCDTAYRVHIQYKSSQVYETVASMNGTEEGYTWTSFWYNGRHVTDSLFTEPGKYEFTSPNETTGCNDVWRLILTKDENSYHFVENLTICQNEPFTWQGLNNLSAIEGENTYTVSYKTRAGNDSVFTLNLNVKPTVRSSRAEYFCDTYVWKGKEYTSSVTVYDTLTSVQHGCDSIVEIRLNKAQPFYDKQEVTIMEGEILNWHGQDVSQEGIYRDRNKTIYGCDSVYELIVTVDPAPNVTPTYSYVTSICGGDSIEWRDNWYKTSGIYKDSIFNSAIRTVENLKEVYILNLTVWPSYTDTIIRHVYLCSDDASYQYYGRPVTKSTFVDTTFQTIHGCDSVERVYFHFSDGTFSSDTVKRFDNQPPYVWPVRPDTSYAVSGTYYYTEQVDGKCANEYELVLKIYPTFLFEENIKICKADAPFDWIVNGNTIAAGLSHDKGLKTYEYKYETIHGADSIYRLNLTIDTVPTRVEAYQMCEGEELYLYGNTYYSKDMKTDSVYRDSVFRSAPNSECDSVIYIEITNRSVQRHIETKVLPYDQSLPITWHTKTIDHFGLTADTVQSSDPNACYKLEFINLVPEVRTIDSICIVDTPYINWRGKMLYDTRLYWDTTYDAATGLISGIYSLDLKIQEVPKRTEVFYVCEGEVKNFYGKEYGKYPYHVVDSVYLDTVQGGHGPSKCDTLVYVKVHLVAAKTSTKTVILEHGQTINWGGASNDKYHITNGGEYRDTIPNVGLGGCDSISILNVIAEEYMPATICMLDTPYVWNINGHQNKYYASGIYHDTVFTDNYKTQIETFSTLDLHITPVKDSTLELRGCLPGGVTWNDITYQKDTTFDDTIRCEALYHVNIKVYQEKYIYKDTIMFEHQLPLIIGRIEPDTIWQEGTYRHDKDTTVFGCDSIVEYNLTIIPKLTRNDSTFVCSDFFDNGGAVWLGDTITPAFNAGGEWTGKWEGKWHGVAYTEDTIVTNWNKTYFHHIIVRPSQTVVKDTVIYICPEDTIMFRAIHPENIWDDSTFFTKDTLYQEIVPMVNTWTDPKHKRTYHNDAYVCDSVTNWRVKVLDIRDKDTTAHKLLGDSIKWGDKWYHYSGDYDSIAKSVDTNVLGEHCEYIYTLHLIMDTMYHYKDTIDLCTPKNKTHTHVWAETGHSQEFTIKVNKDTIGCHFVEKLKSHEGRDSIYDLVVNYSMIKDTLLFATICYEEEYQFHSHRNTQEWFLDQPGKYVDTINAANGCDSIITLQLYKRPRILPTVKHVTVTDRQLPYAWPHKWYNQEKHKDTTYIDSIRVSGAYEYRMPSINSCDSVDSLYLTVHQTHDFRDTITVCAPINTTQTHVWTSTGYSQSFQTPAADEEKEYADTLLNTFYPLDSIYYLYVKYHRTYETHKYDTICEGTPYRFGDQDLVKTGIYHDTLETVYRCDSVITMHLQVWPKSPTYYREVDINVNDTPYIWPHTWYNKLEKKDTTYYDTLYVGGTHVYPMPNIHGCDSIDSLTLRIHPNYLFKDSVTICASETPYTWYGPDSTVYKTDIYTTGLYSKEWKTANNFGDSIRTRLVTVLPVKDSTIVKTICEGDFYDFNGKKLTESNIYRDTIKAVNQCDSIITLNLIVNKPYYNSVEKHIIEGDSVVMNGKVFKKDTIYTFKGLTPQLCDSTIKLKVVVHPLVDTIVTVCSHDLPYMWVNKWDKTIVTPLYAAGLYRNDTIVNGEQTFNGIRLIVNKPSDSTIVKTICEGDFYLFNGKKLTESNVYRDTVKAVNKCDSIITLNLIVNKPYYNYVEKHIIEGDSVVMNGKVFKQDTTYTFKGLTPQLCDSTIKLKVIVHPMVDTTVYICSHDLPYMWVNKWDKTIITPLYAAGLYRNDTILNGEPTFNGIRLIVNKPSDSTIVKTICEGDFYLFNGKKLTESNIYRDTLTAANTCDSIITLNLIVNKPYYNYVEKHIVQGDSVVMNGKVFKQDTLYTFKGQTPQHCDSTIELKVVVHPMVDTIVTVCSTDLPYMWVNKWDKTKVTPIYAAGTYRNDSVYVNGKQTFYGMKLIVLEVSETVIRDTICEGDSKWFGGQSLTKAGRYSYSIGNDKGCDSIVTLILTVGQRYYRSFDKTIYEGDTLVYNKKKYWKTGIYKVVDTTTVLGCDSVVEMNLSVVRLYDESINICYDELPYKWRLMSDTTKVKEIYKTGIYRDTIMQEGKMAIYGIMVNVLPITYDTIRASVCEGDAFVFDQQEYKEPGKYTKTFKNINGCDSIVTLILNVNRKYHTILDRTIFKGDTVHFNNKIYTKTGIYQKYDTTVFGCDSLVELRLTVNNIYDDSVSICFSELPYRWRLMSDTTKVKEIYESGLYRDTIIQTDGRKVVKGLMVNVLPIAISEQSLVFCEGDSVIYRNTVYKTNGTFYDTIRMTSGCDSIIKINVTVHPTYEHYIVKHISDQEIPYPFGDRKLSESGIYERIASAPGTGCDSIVHLELTVHPTYFFDDTVHLCLPDTFVWHGQSITKEGLYYDSLYTAYGYDSVYHLRVGADQKYFINEKIEIVPGYSISLHGINISKPGTYLDTLTSSHGCDSIYNIIVNSKRTMEIYIRDSICQGDYYSFFGKSFSHAVEDYIYTSKNGDSIVHLNLKVNPVSMTEERVVLTNLQAKSGYIHGGRYYDNLPEEGTMVYKDTLVAANGCDSVSRLVIVVTKHYSEWIPIPLCPGSEVKIDDQVITKAGLYTFLRLSKISGLQDSLLRVEVYDAPAYDLPAESRVICQGDTVRYAGREFTRGGHYDIPLKTKEGCDSLMHLDLTVYPTYHIIENAVITDYEGYYWHGRTYTDTTTSAGYGKYTMDIDRSWSTINDCDSTHTLRLTVVETKRYHTDDTICIGQDYIWRGDTIRYEGNYVDTIRRVETYYSAIYSLHLVTVRPTVITSARTSDVCADAEGFDITFNYSGQKPAIYSVYFDVAAKRAGFKDVINAQFDDNMTAHVSLPTFATICYETHPYYVRPDNYTMRLVLDNGVCGLSRSDSIKLQIKYPSWIIEQNWTDVVAPLSADYNGGFDFANTEWYINGVLMPTNGQGYLYNTSLQPGDQVHMVATRRGENYSIPSCPITIEMPTPDVYVTPVIVYPTQAPRHAPVVTIEAPQDGEFDIFSTTGMHISGGKISEGKTQVTLPAVRGIYFIRTTQGKEKPQVHKVILY